MTSGPTSDPFFGQYPQIHGFQAGVGAGLEEKSAATEHPWGGVLVDQWKSGVSAHECEGVARMHKDVAQQGAEVRPS